MPISGNMIARHNYGGRRGNEADQCIRWPGNPPRYLGGYISVFILPLLGTSTILQAQTGTINDVQHVVIFIQENRSFDEYFGSLKGAHGFSDRNALIFQNGNTDLYQPQGGSYLLPFHTTNHCLNDVAHDWGSSPTA